MKDRTKIIVYFIIFLIGSVYITMGISSSIKYDPIIVTVLVHIASICGVAIISGGILGVIIKFQTRVKYKDYEYVSISNNLFIQLLCLVTYLVLIILTGRLDVESSHLEFISIIVPFSFCSLLLKGNKEFIILKDRILFFHSNYKLYVVDGIQEKNGYYEVNCKNSEDKIEIIKLGNENLKREGLEGQINKLDNILKKED